MARLPQSIECRPLLPTFGAADSFVNELLDSLQNTPFTSHCGVFPRRVLPLLLIRDVNDALDLLGKLVFSPFLPGTRIACTFQGNLFS
jgi:hypothetical protein